MTLPFQAAPAYVELTQNLTHNYQEVEHDHIEDHEEANQSGRV